MSVKQTQKTRTLLYFIKLNHFSPGGLLVALMGPLLCRGSSCSGLSFLSSLKTFLSCIIALSSCLRTAMDALMAASICLSSSSLQRQANNHVGKIKRGRCGQNKSHTVGHWFSPWISPALLSPTPTRLSSSTSVESHLFIIFTWHETWEFAPVLIHVHLPQTNRQQTEWLRS